MKLDNLSIEIHPRSSWKAFDLGCRMALAWWPSLAGFWLMVTLPFFVVFSLVDITWGMLLFWLLKPLYERGLLYILSRRVFGQPVTAIEAVKAWPSQLKKQWFASITWRRLSPSRGFDLAVVQLEGLSSNARSKRLNILHRTTDDNSGWWTIICVHWELFILLGMITLVGFVIPQGVDFDYWNAIVSDSWQVEFSINVMLFFVYVLIAPFYIAGSFAAYLNRRILLEGWDIEINFKRIANQYGGRLNSVLLAGVFSAFMWFAPHNDAMAQQTADQPLLYQLDDTDGIEQQNIAFESEAQIQQILDEPPFNGEEVEKRYRWVGWGSDEEDDQSTPPSGLPAWLIKVITLIANISEVFIWLVFGSLLLMLLYFSRHNIAQLFSRQEKLPLDEPFEMPSFSQAFQNEELPDDIVKEIERLLALGAFRKVMSLMLISSLLEISKHQSLPLTKSMTERECLHVIKQSVSGELGEFMDRLIDAWVKLAWAHQWPSFEQMSQLHQDWRGLFPVIEAAA